MDHLTSCMHLAYMAWKILRMEFPHKPVHAPPSPPGEGRVGRPMAVLHGPLKAHHHIVAVENDLFIPVA